MSRQINAAPAPTRHTVVAAAVLLLELYTYQRYAAYGAQFHFWLHALLGGWLGLGVLVLWRLISSGRRQRAGPADSAFAGHLISAVPDLLFVVLGVLHATWMDVFGVHVSVHFVPAPLLVVLGLWGLALLAFAALTLQARRLAGAALLTSAVLLAGALALRDPIPSDLQDVRQLQTGSLAALAAASRCSVAR